MNKSNQKFKLSFKKSVFLSCVILGISLLTACGSSDKTLPIIDSIELLPASVIITASDDIGVTGYVLTTTVDKPNAKDDVWTTNTEFTLEAMGTYYAYAKDESGNVSDGYLVDVTNNTTFERLAKEYDHLAWIIAPDTDETKNLKDKYGDLYPMVEPLTEQQIKDRWVYLVNHLVKENEFYAVAYNGGLDISKLGDEFQIQINKFSDNANKAIMESSDPDINKFKNHYSYMSSLERYVYFGSDSFTSRETQFGVGLEIIDKVSLFEMESFVRYYMIETNKTINMAQEQGKKLNFCFDPLN